MQKVEDFTEINGIGKKTEEKLKNAGFKTFVDLENASIEQLTGVKGIFNATAEKIKNYFKEQDTNFQKEEVDDKKGEKASVNPLKKELNRKLIPSGNLDRYINATNKGTSSNLSVQQSKEIFEEEVYNDENSEILDYEEELLDDDTSKLPNYDQLTDVMNNEKDTSIVVENSEKKSDETIETVESAEDEEDINTEVFDSEDLAKMNYDETEFDGNFTKLPDVGKMLEEGEVSGNSGLSSVINEFVSEEKDNSTAINEEEPQKKRKELSLVREESDETRGELLSSVEIQKIINSSKDALKSQDYSILSKKIKGTDFLAIKVVKAKDLVDHVVIVPLKVLPLRGSVIVSHEDVKYMPADRAPKQVKILVQKEFLTPVIETLVKVPKMIYSNINEEGSIFRFLKSYLKVNVKIEKSRSGEVLFFRDGMLQFKIFVEPIVICKDETHSSENSIAFPYFPEGNLHVINYVSLQNLVNYLETKYKTIEKYDTEKDNDIVQYFKVKNKTIDRLRLLSFPFVLFSGIFLLLIAFQLFAAIRVFTLLSYGILSLYFLVIIYVYYNFYAEKKKILEKAKTPFYERKLELDEYDLSFLKEELDFDTLKQFSYECFNFENDVKLSSSLTKVSHRNQTENSLLESPLEKNPLRSTKKSQYGTFLED